MKIVDMAINSRELGGILGLNSDQINELECGRLDISGDVLDMCIFMLGGIKSIKE